MNLATQFMILSITSFSLVGIITPFMRKFALRISFLDKPNSLHKTHDEPIPYLGGVAIILGICITVYFALLTQPNLRNELPLASSILIPALVLGIVGLIDDYASVAALTRLIVQTVAGIFSATILILSDSIGNPTNNVFLDASITVFWIVGITNSINFFDNLDGGAAGAVAATSLGLFLIAHQSGQFLVAATSVTIFGSMLGFLVWNKSPAKIYMGDAGALFLGILISTLSVRLDPEVKSQVASLSIPLLLLAIPILDTSVAVISRIRRKISIFQGGRDHLSHRLIKRGLSRKQAALLLWILCGLYVGLATLIATSSLNSTSIILIAGAGWLCLFAVFLKLEND